MNEQIKQMHSMAISAMAKSYSPYSKFKVGACILTSSGNMYSGCNIENASYPCGNCAEASAIASMVLAGEKEIKEILVIGGLNGIVNDDIITPCGQCRQRINEFTTNNCIIHCANNSKILYSTTLKDLLPKAFGPNNLI